MRNVIEKIKRGEVEKEDLVIYTQLRKKNYEVKSPELAAAEKARKRGMKISTGSIIGYIITRGGGSISDRAEIAEFAKDYDPDYYINNQVLPAVMKIIGELGYSEEDIKYLYKAISFAEVKPEEIYVLIYGKNSFKSFTVHPPILEVGG